MKILLVGGGLIPIPPPSWGGAENVIHQQSLYLKAAGHDVDILNKKRRKVITALRARPWRYDLVHLHHDDRSRMWNRFSRVLGFKLAVTSHYGYSAFPDKWVPRYHRTFHEMMDVRHLIVLSPEIADLMRQRGYRHHLHVLPNGIGTDDMAFAPKASRQSVVLGRIEPRKKQEYLSQILVDHPRLECDLIGPSDYPEFTGNDKNVRFLGPWTREQVMRDLTQYACMVLISDGEAHAGVILEAMAAGLSLVISPEVAHNLDTDQPWVHVVDRDKPEEIAAAMERAVRENEQHRPAIRRYCRKNFDWEVIGPRYVSIIEEIVRGQAGKAPVPTERRGEAGHVR